jgi:hypothetical protein
MRFLRFLRFFSVFSALSAHVKEGAPGAQARDRGDGGRASGLVMADLFRQEVILCAESPLSLTDGFKKLQIRVHDRAVETRTEALATTTTYVSDPDQELRLVKICHILSELTGGSACIAIPYNETTIYVICEVMSFPLYVMPE